MAFTLRMTPERRAALARLVAETGATTQAAAVWRAIEAFPGLRRELADARELLREQMERDRREIDALHSALERLTEARERRLDAAEDEADAAREAAALLDRAALETELPETGRNRDGKPPESLNGGEAVDVHE